MGCNHDICEVLTWEQGTFFVAAIIRHSVSGLIWVVVCVYGPVDHSRSASFLEEVSSLVGAKRAANIPLVVGCDFNLIRSSADKDNDRVDWARVSMFNNAIAAVAHREAVRIGARYT